MVKLSEGMILARNRGAELETVKKLNCWGSELTDVSLVRKLPAVEILSFSVNGITSLSDFQYCKNLQELYLRKNKIHDLSEILYLKDLPRLRKLWLEENPCADLEGYRLTVLKHLPHLEKLDNVSVEESELREAYHRGLDLLHPEDKYQMSETPAVSTRRPPSIHNLVSVVAPPGNVMKSNNANDSDASSSSNASLAGDPSVGTGGMNYPHEAYETYRGGSDLSPSSRRPPPRPGSRKTSYQQPPTAMEGETSPTYLRRRPSQSYEEIAPRRLSHAGETEYVEAEEYERRLSQPSLGRGSGGTYRRQTTYVSPSCPVHPVATPDPPPCYQAPSPGNYVIASGDVISQSSRSGEYDDRQLELRRQAIQQYELTYQQATQQIDQFHRMNMTGTYPSGRQKSRTSNLLSAVLCLLRELDVTSLEVVETAVKCRIQELED